jgi:hypothetical protein
MNLSVFLFFESPELGPNTRARTIYFPTRAGLAQDFSARAKLEFYCYLNEPILDRQYPFKIGSFTPLGVWAYFYVSMVVGFWAYLFH